MAFGWDDLIVGGLSLFGNLFGAHKQAQSADKSASLTADATKYAADQSLETNREATAYAASQSVLDRATAEANRRGNYDQWRAHDQNVGTLGQLAGLPARVSPAYVPLPSAAGGGAPSASADYQPLMSALNKGLSPQAAIEQFNKSQGLQTGGSYAWRAIPEAAGGGVVEIPGGSYLSPTGPNGSWVWSAGDSGGSAPAPRSTVPTTQQAPRTLLDYAQLGINAPLTGQVFLPPSLRA